MRLYLLALLAIGCGKRSNPESSAIYHFLPDKPELVVRVDVAKLRAWPKFATLAPALKMVESAVELPKRECGLDLVSESATFVVALRGSARDGDVSAVVTGLPRDKTTACLAKLAKHDPTGFVVDGTTFQLVTSGTSTASGAILAGGEAVLVSRAGRGVDPTAWKQEVAAAPTPPPAWWTEMSPTAPIATRVVTTSRTAVASIDLGDPLVVHGTLISADEAAAKADLETYKAVLGYLQSGGAGTGRLEARGATVYGDFTAKGAEIDTLLGMALPALFQRQTSEASLVDPAGPQSSDCASLTDAIARYLASAMASAAPDTKAAMQQHLDVLQGKLAKAYLDSCTADHWSATSITCHVQNAASLKQFEHCRDTLTAEQRTHFDEAIKQATASP